MAAKPRTRSVESPPPNLSPGALSPTGQWIGWGFWGLLIFLGFCFGVWSGTRSATATKATIEVADGAQTRPETPAKPEGQSEPKHEEHKPPHKTEPPKKEPSKKEPPSVTAPVKPPPPPKKKEEPKKEPTKPSEPPAEVVSVSFKEIKPIFVRSCIVCHEGPRAKKEVDLTSVAMIMKGSKKGPILKVGDLKESSIWTTVESGEMPPDDSMKPPLTADEKKLLKNWVLSGAKP